MNKPRGRPVGSRAYRLTPAMRRAWQYFGLRLQGHSPGQAAGIVADQWQVADSTVKKDWQRHQARLMDAYIKHCAEADEAARPKVETVFPLSIKHCAEADEAARKRRDRAEIYRMIVEALQKPSFPGT